MMFVYPTFLWALLAITVPVIIHLFNFRRYKKVYFTNVRFLKDIRHESKSKSRLKELLILFMRCLAIMALVIAFAQPYFPETSAQQANAGSGIYSLYLDNSFSMENIEKNGPLLDVARNQMKQFVKGKGEADRFQIITNDFEGRHQRFYSRTEVLERIDEIKATSTSRKLSEVLSRQRDVLSSAGAQNKGIYVFSDMQRSTSDLANCFKDTSVHVTIVPFHSSVIGNVYVDSCWFSTPVQQKGFIQKLYARIKNSSETSIQSASAKLNINGRITAIAAFSVDAHSETRVEFIFECKESGFNYCSIKIEDHPVTFDDELFFAFSSRINIKTTLITGSGQTGPNAFSSLFAADSMFVNQNYSERNIDFSNIRNSDLVVLDGVTGLTSGIRSELLNFVRNGGFLVVAPPEGMIKNIDYDQFLKDIQLSSALRFDTSSVRTTLPDIKNEFFTGVFEKIEDRMNLPLIRGHYVFMPGSRGKEEVLLPLQNNDPFLFSVPFGAGKVYLFTSPFLQEYTNFPRHALFVPVVYRICLSAIKTGQLYYEAGDNAVISMQSQELKSDQPPHIRGKNVNLDFIPEVREQNFEKTLSTRGHIKEKGFYEITSDQKAMQPLAFNYSRTESDLVCYSAGELEDYKEQNQIKHLSVINETSEKVSEMLLSGQTGLKLWKLFIILALTFLLIEILLLRILK